jgi:hypothetical protein
VVPALDRTVVGGENFVIGDPVQSATSRENDPHGTWVGTTIAGHVGFLFSNTSSLVQSLNINAPGSVIPCTAVSPPCPADLSIVPMIGTAPASKIYALKIFDSRGEIGAPTSRVIAAMDRAITLRRNFNDGEPSVPVAGDGSEEQPFKFDSLNIQVVNMSLGGPTLFAGNDFLDQLTLEMLKVGITIVVSAGNDGFPAMTGSTPGTGLGSLTVAAANTSIHERILRDLQLGVGYGRLYRPTTHHQTAFFSSRGPTADGRFDPEVIANGFATFAQGTCQGVAACIAGAALAPISLVSGTSFSSPITAGGAALLRHEVPSASAAQIRNAIIESANPKVLGDGSGPIDQGQGFIDLSAALKLLDSGKVSDRVIPENYAPGESVERNIAALGFRPVRFAGDRFSERVMDLVPGQVAQFFVRTFKDSDQLTVALRNVTPELPPEQQNQIFGDDIFLQIADAPTSFNVTRATAFLASDETFTIDNPQTGLVRVALQGDWTNAGKISADLEIVQHRTELGKTTAEGTVAQGDMVPVVLSVLAGTQVLEFSLFWENDWAHYPTNDLDLILVDPNGELNLDAATLNSPERAVIEKPTPGTWIALVNGFTVNTGRDEWQLRALADAVLLKPSGRGESSVARHDPL